MIRRLTAMVVALGLACNAWAAGGNLDEAKGFVGNVASEVIEIVKKPGSKDLQQAQLVGLIDAKVDIDFVAKFVLGKYWRTATDEQRTAYLDAYRPFLKKNYVSRLTRYTGQTFKLGDARVDDDGSYIVNMEIIDPNGANVEMLYRVVEAPKTGYRIADIVVEGVSLLTTQRSEFNAIVTSKGLDYLIDTLKQRGAA